MKRETSGKNVLIVGGYGVVGRQIARILHDRYPELNLWLGGRNPAAAPVVGSTRIRAVVVDNGAEDPLQEVGEEIALIINAVNDPRDLLLMAAVRRAIPLVDVTRWTEGVQRSIHALQTVPAAAPVVFSSGWMGGTAALLAAVYGHAFREPEVEIYSLYSLKDKAGPDSAAYMDRMSIPFELLEGGERRSVYPMTDPVAIRFPNRYRTNCYRLDTPDHVTLPQRLKASSASFRIAFDSRLSTFSLLFLIRTGIWRAIGGDRFRGLRRRLLYNPGSGSPHHLVIRLRERGAAQWEQSIDITDPQGQTHLTALGAVIQAESLLRRSLDAGANGVEAIRFPEDALHTGMTSQEILDFYRLQGVVIQAAKAKSAQG